MHAQQLKVDAAATLVVLIVVSAPATAQQAQSPDRATTASRATSHRLGVEIFGGAAVTWPAASDSFEATGLDSKPVEFGGGAGVTGIWRGLFAQVAFTRWSDTGERVFIDSRGNQFPLGIPLDVEAKYLDVTAGWKGPGGRVLPYVGGGVGVAMYRESSPFADGDEDLDTKSASYHVLAGVEIPLVRWLAVGVEGRYRYIPDILGEHGASAALGDESLGGFQTSVALRAGFGGAPPPPKTDPRRAQPVSESPVEPPSAPATRAPGAYATITSDRTPVYLLPDATRTPLRELAKGTSVRVLERAGDWLRIEFPDPQFGPRVGYVLSRFVEVRNPNTP